MMEVQRPAARLDKRVSTPHVYAALQHNPIRLARPGWSIQPDWSRGRINLLVEESVMTTTAKTKVTEKAASVIETTQDQFAKAAETQFKAADEVAAFGKSNVEAFIQAGTIFFHGFEQIARTMVSLTQAQVEANMTTAKALISAKTLTELTDLQNAYSKSTFDHVVSEATQLSELAIKITNEAIEPISARVTATIEQMSKPVFAVA
jgi:phasin family protein